MSEEKKKTLCRLSEKKVGEKYRELVRGARFLCRRCGRAARDPERLCKPEPL